MHEHLKQKTITSKKVERYEMKCINIMVFTCRCAMCDHMKLCITHHLTPLAGLSESSASGSVRPVPTGAASENDNVTSGGSKYGWMSLMSSTSTCTVNAWWKQATIIIKQ